MKNSLLIISILLSLSLSPLKAVESSSTYCMMNSSIPDFYVYNSSSTYLGKVAWGKPLHGIQKSDFPLTIADCDPEHGGLKCAPSDNKLVKDPGCYDVYYYAGYTALRWSCLVGCGK